MNTEIRVHLDTIEKVRKFISIINKSIYEIELHSGKHNVDAKSITGVFSVNLSKPVKLVSRCDLEKEILEKLKEFEVK